MHDETTVVLVRHGETDWNRARRWQGQLDVPLNENGLRQAAAVARRLARWPLSALYSSDLMRASATAAAIAAAAGLTLHLEPCWRERHAGDFQGMTRDERRRRFPTLAAEFDADHSAAPPGGESQADLLARVLPTFDALLDRHPGDTVAVVTHGGVIHALTRTVLGLGFGGPPVLTFRGNTGLTIIEARADRRTVVVLNDTGHLEGLKWDV